ncbi:hypothetical protein Tco_1563940 [Tanacetum coccineum]
MSLNSTLEASSLLWQLSCAGPPKGPAVPVVRSAVGYDQLSSTLSSLQISSGLPLASLKSQHLKVAEKLSLSYSMTKSDTNLFRRVGVREPLRVVVLSLMMGASGLVGESIKGGSNGREWEGSGEDHGESGDDGGVDIARSLATSASDHTGVGTGAGIEILAVTRYAGCGGGVAADSSVSNGSVSSADGA